MIHCLSEAAQGALLTNLNYQSRLAASSREVPGARRRPESFQRKQRNSAVTQSCRGSGGDHPAAADPHQSTHHSGPGPGTLAAGWTIDSNGEQLFMKYNIVDICLFFRQDFVSFLVFFAHFCLKCSCSRNSHLIRMTSNEKYKITWLKPCKNVC